MKSYAIPVLEGEVFWGSISIVDLKAETSKNKLLSEKECGAVKGVNK